jgi:hypothetical protein
MSQKFVDAASLVSGDRLVGVYRSVRHLSDGTCVYLVNNVGTGVVLMHSGADHATPASIHTFSGFASAELALCVDSLDNIYVVGVDATNAQKLRARAFTKGVGYSWTAQTALVGASNLWGGTTGTRRFVAVWCNTGGGTSGKGHVLVAGQRIIEAGYAILDAGALAAGSGTLVVNQALSPTFLANGGSVNTNSDSIDLSSDGFGVAHGLAIASQSSTTALGVGTWAVNSSGALSTNSSLTGASPKTTGSMSGSKAFVARYASDAWVIVAPDSGTPTNYAVARWTSSGQATAFTTSTIGSLTLARKADTTSWAVMVDPSTANRAWIIVLGSESGGSSNVRRGYFDVASGVTVGSAVLDDTLTNTYATQDGLRAVKEPRGFAVDWQAYVQTSASDYALDGDFTQFNRPPTAATWATAAGAYDVDESLPLDWTPQDPDVSDTQSAYALKRDIGGTVRYWRASDSTWQVAEVKNSSPTSAATLPSGWGSDGDVDHQYLAKTWDASDAEGTYNTALLITPSAKVNPTLTSPADGGTVTSNRFSGSWTVASASAYLLELLDDDGSTVLDETGWVDVGAERGPVTLDYLLSDGDSYQARVTTKNLEGLASDSDTSSFTADFTLPAEPVAVIDDSDGVAIEVAVSNPAPGVGEPSVTSNDLYRRPVGDTSTGVRVAVGVADGGSFRDVRVGHLQQFEYRWLAHADNGADLYGDWTSSSAEPDPALAAEDGSTLITEAGLRLLVEA